MSQLMALDSSRSFEQPAVFGRYILLRRISRGGMGEIYLAKLGEIQGFEKPIVIKKILPNLAQDADFLQRFIEEAKIAIKLTHGNIVPVYEVGMVSGEYFLALQYVGGRDLRSLLTRCSELSVRIPPELCLLVVREVTNGLAYAHRKTDEAGRPLDLVHCDISPPNVLVSWEGEIKIIDFGIAKSAIQRAQRDTSVGFGKFGYMAPEQLVRGGKVDRRSDIYSTGVLLYELLTAQRVFNFPAGVDYRHVAREVTAGRFAPPSARDASLGDSFDELVMRALKTELRERYASAEHFRDAIQQHLYSMNPTISADSLSEFMHKIFELEIAQDLAMLRSLTQTDVTAYSVAIADKRADTVSFALSQGWRQSPLEELASLADQLPGSRELSGSAEADSGHRDVLEAGASSSVLAETSGMFGLVGAHDLATLAGSRPATQTAACVKTRTRKLSAREQYQEGLSLADRELTLLRQMRRRRALAIVLTPMAVTAVAVTLLLWALNARQPASRGTAAPTVLAASTKPAPSPSPAPPAEPASQPAPPEPVAETDPAVTGEDLHFAPDLVERSDAHGKEPPATRGADHGARKSGNGHAGRNARPPASAGAKPMRRKPSLPKKRPISTEVVQRKFSQVRDEYGRFTKAYGGLLDSQWQKILFANTYGDMDANKYDRLNAMLDDLRRRMKAARDGS